jgi:hypothetical protein
MPFKNPDDKLAWQRANKERCAEYKRKWEQTDAGKAYIAKQIERRELQKQATAIRRASEKIERAQQEKKPRAKKDRLYRARARQKAIELLGSVCCVCGMDDPDVLEFDHIEPLLRRTTGEKRKDVYKMIHACQDPLAEFQLLCSNCHTKKTRMNNEFMLPSTPPRQRYWEKP